MEQDKLSYNTIFGLLHIMSSTSRQPVTFTLGDVRIDESIGNLNPDRMTILPAKRRLKVHRKLFRMHKTTIPKGDVHNPHDTRGTVVLDVATRYPKMV